MRSLSASSVNIRLALQALFIYRRKREKKAVRHRSKTASALSEDLYWRNHMKRSVWVLALALAMSGCASVSDINQTPPTMSVISGKKPHEYAKCVSDKLASSRGSLQMEPHKNGVRLIVPGKLSTLPAAVFDIDERSSGSSIKLHESLSNVPVRPGDVQDAANACISG